MSRTQKLKSLDRVRRKYREFHFQMWIIRGTSAKNKRDTYSYKVVTPTGVTFEGTDYMPPKSIYGNGEKILDGLLKWICATPEDTDTDADYFKLYNQEQWEWSKSAECAQVRTELAEIQKTV